MPQAQADRDYWKKTGNVRIMKRISALLEDILKHPFTTSYFFNYIKFDNFIQ